MRDTRRYRIGAVDASDEDVAEELQELHAQTFLDRAPMPNFEIGDWWMATMLGQPVAFAGLVPSTIAAGIGYLSRVGVLREHCGYGLQRRLMRRIEQGARRAGLYCIVSDTTDNIVSANNFIGCGYVLFQPRQPWAWESSLYWRKMIRP